MTKDILNNQLGMLEEKLSKVPDTAANKGLWESLLYILTGFNVVIGKLDDAVRGDGNGEKGILNRLTTVERDVKDIKITQDEILRIVRSEKTTPLTKATFGQWFVERVLPGLVQTAIITLGAIITLLAISHWTELKILGL